MTSIGCRPPGTSDHDDAAARQRGSTAENDQLVARSDVGRSLSVSAANSVGGLDLCNPRADRPVRQTRVEKFRGSLESTSSRTGWSRDADVDSTVLFVATAEFPPQHHQQLAATRAPITRAETDISLHKSGRGRRLSTSTCEQMLSPATDIVTS